MIGSLQTHFWAVREYLSPVLRDSKFKESGRITPEEFVAAGDFLVYKFPTWKWEAGDAGRRREYLPADKQYLVSRNVPCLRRVSQLAYGASEEDAETLLAFGGEEGDGEDEWVATHTATGAATATQHSTIGDIPDIDPTSSLTDALASTSLETEAPPMEEMPDMDDIPDMDSDDGMGGGLVVEEEDEAAIQFVAPGAASAGDDASNLIQVRTYDCSITYDKYYQTPRMWLQGYDEQKHPLPPTTALSDISTEHAHKTVTIEPFPHSSSSMASVHPCKHASVMKRVVERMDRGLIEAQKRRREAGSEESAASSADKSEVKESKWKKLLGSKSEKKDGEDVEAVEDEGGLRVDQYLVVFLKFISTIVPTIEVDATNSI